MAKFQDALSAVGARPVDDLKTFKVEQRGIDLVPLAARWGRPNRLFWMWAGAVWNVEFVVYGALMVVVFGLSFLQAVVIVVVGNLSYVLTGLASLQGPAAGTTTFGVSRAPFGSNGNRVPALFNWVTLVGFEILGIVLVVFAGIALADKSGVVPGTQFKIGLIIGACLVQGVLPFFGHATMLQVLRWLALPFIVLFVIMAILAASKVNLSAAHHGAGWGSLFVALALVISSGGLSWTENGNDYSRYLPPDTNKKRIVAAVAFGAGIPTLLLEVLGAAVATGVAGATSVTGLLGAFTPWFTWPFLVFVIIQLFAINTVALYSSGVTLQAIGLPFKRVYCVIIDTVIAGGFTAYAVFSNRFYTLLSDFLLFIIVWLAPWCAIYLVDWWLRGGRYDPAALVNTRAGRYFRNGGIRWPAIAAQAVGMVTAALWLNAYSPYVSPLSSRIGGSDFSVFMGLFFGGVTYFLLARKSVRAESQATPARPWDAIPNRRS